MTHVGAIILGIVEGFTEFIPVSSSGHLLIARQLLGLNDSNGLSFDAVIQFSTTLALIVYFWKDIKHLFFSFIALVSGGNIVGKEKIEIYSIILGTIPAVIFGLLLEKKMETVFRNIHLVAVSLIFGSLLMWIAQKFSKQNSILSIRNGIKIGFFQCLALIPGVSRSGATISGGLFSGLSREEAVRFSFLLSVPILVGSGLKKIFEIRNEIFQTGFGVELLLSSFFAFIFGFLSIRFLIKYLKSNNLSIFIWYRVLLAVSILLFIK